MGPRKLPRAGKNNLTPDKSGSTGGRGNVPGLGPKSGPGVLNLNSLKRVPSPQPQPGSVEMVIQTAEQFGQKISKAEARQISRLLRGWRESK